MTDTTAETKTCPDCKADVPADARKCSHCGTEFSSRAREFVVFAVVALVVAMGAGLWMMNKQADDARQMGQDRADQIKCEYGIGENC